uniref:Uncharacterized protein AlNc14C349G10896 n=1 Tax=Albugo laibachii Nc14 TaxID=890382 RepID=F0WXE5_9STRA|nr:conserved hypothetical protein [Albugo laibachii Nc14]|eukprot:CCA26137.1 conserved hypothetical protein [Albugo laibachii Nc14]
MSLSQERSISYHGYGKYEARDIQIKSQSTRAFDLEEEYRKITKKLTMNDFELKPIPRPDEARSKEAARS